MTTGTQLKHLLRAARGDVERVELEERTGVSRHSIAAYEQGGRVPSRRALDALLNGLEVTEPMRDMIVQAWWGSGANS